ncbi:MAG: hypothetical protein ACI81T_002963, partial [Bacteroidia bacterium]
KFTIEPKILSVAMLCLLFLPRLASKTNCDNGALYLISFTYQFTG